MTEDILINVTPFETRVALVAQGAVQELHMERAIQRGQVGNIYLGKVVRVLPGMQSAFIDIGLEKAAFLHIADLRENRNARTQNTPTIAIEKLLFEGQSLMTQVIKDPIGTKGARLSTQISIAGRMLVYLPHEPHIGISQKIGSESERQALRDRVQALEDSAKAYNAIAEDLKLVPHTAKNAHGLHYGLAVDVHAKKGSRLVKTDVRKDIQPALASLLAKLERTTSDYRADLAKEQDEAEELELQSASLAEQRSLSEGRSRRAEEAYRREKDTLDQATELHSE
jgi:hypothetical protein